MSDPIEADIEMAGRMVHRSDGRSRIAHTVAVGIEFSQPGPNANGGSVRITVGVQSGQRFGNAPNPRRLHRHRQRRVTWPVRVPTQP